MEKYIVIGVGGFIGSILRFQVNKITNSLFHIVEFGTLIVNLTGAFIIGIISTLITYNFMSNQYKLFIIVGILGGFTTFSTFSLEIVNLLQSGKYILSLILIILNVCGSIIATILGILLIFYLKNYTK